MTTPNVERRFEFTVEVPGTPEQVWDAIATARGMSAWMMPTELDERVGGAVRFHMGPETSEGEVTAWEPPRRIAYAEDWATLAGQDPSTVTPLVSEFVVEAQAGGTCVVRVVSSAFGVGADWEQEFFDDMATGWAPMFDHLRVYLEHFAGLEATMMEVEAPLAGSAAEVADAMRRALGIHAAGDTVDALGAKAIVEHIAGEHTLLRTTDPVPGFLALFAFRGEPGTAHARVAGYLFADDAPAWIEREQPRWQEWLTTLTPSTTPGATA
ncbi:MAG TPA: SRPBCC domain-containing protein [Acidimicrobiia bacterium]|nr:SRPBCC domain-containing protein [Acidimicrobiia bacterium]